MFDPLPIERIEQVAMSRGHSVLRMSSGAGHDAQMLARVCPFGTTERLGVEGTTT